MNITKVRIELNYEGVGELLRSYEMAADLKRRGKSMVAAINNRHILVEGDPGKVPLPVIEETKRDKERARTRVILDHPSGQAVEAKHRVLVGSLDAARR